MPMIYPEGYGKLLPANSTVFFQMHYHKTPGSGTGGIDQTSVGLTFHDEEPENVIATMWIVDPVLAPTEPKLIPAGTRIADEMMVGFLHYSFVDKSQQVDMPTFAVPEALSQQFEQMQKFRDEQRKAKAEGESGDR